MIIRPMQVDDQQAVLNVARMSLANPWNMRQLAGELQFPGGLQLVAEHDVLCGYAFFRQAGPEAELLQLAVLPLCRRKGIASTLLRCGLGQLYAQQAEVCFLEVRRSSQAVCLFYEQAGFHRVGLRKKYYSRPLDDAVIMRKTVDKDMTNEDNS